MDTTILKEYLSELHKHIPPTKGERHKFFYDEAVGELGLELHLSGEIEMVYVGKGNLEDTDFNQLKSYIDSLVAVKSQTYGLVAQRNI